MKTIIFQVTIMLEVTVSIKEHIIPITAIMISFIPLSVMVLCILNIVIMLQFNKICKMIFCTYERTKTAEL